MDATCAIQASIHVFSLVRKYVSRILGTYQIPVGFFLRTYAAGILRGSLYRTWRISDGYRHFAGGFPFPAEDFRQQL